MNSDQIASEVVVTMTSPFRMGSNLLEMLDSVLVGRLTCEHAQSSHGLPVLVLESGEALGSAEAGRLTVLAIDTSNPIVARARDAGYAVDVAP